MRLNAMARLHRAVTPQWPGFDSLEESLRASSGFIYVNCAECLTPWAFPEGDTYRSPGLRRSRYPGYVKAKKYTLKGFHKMYNPFRVEGRDDVDWDPG